MTAHDTPPGGFGTPRTTRARGRLQRPSATTRTTVALTAIVTVCLVAMTATAAVASPAKSSTSSLDAATKRAAELQRRIDDLEAEKRSLQLRLDSTAYQLRTQEKAAAHAQAQADQALEALRGRAVAMYKSSEVDGLALLLNAVTWSDLVTRASLVTRMLETDSRMMLDAEAAAERARREAESLSRLQKEGLALRELQRQRVDAARTALAEQKRIVATLTDTQKRALASAKGSKGSTGKSPAGGTRIPKVPVVVHPYDDVTFLAADYAPKTFRATGDKFSGVASWYGKAVDGHKTASGRVFNHEDFTCAHRSLRFGTWLAVTRGNRRVVVMVTDRGPYTSGRVLDLSESAAEALGFRSSGLATVDAEVIVPD